MRAHKLFSLQVDALLELNARSELLNEDIDHATRIIEECISFALYQLVSKGNVTMVHILLEPELPLDWRDVTK